MNENKKRIILGGIIGAIVLLGIVVFMMVGRNSDQAKSCLETYMSSIQKKDYEKAYEQIGNKKEWKKDDFIARVKNIYEGIDMKNMKVTYQDTSEKDDTKTITCQVKMDTIAGTLEYKGKTDLVKGKDGYRIDWNSSMIFPKLSDTDTIRVEVDKGVRGNITDRKGDLIATQGSAFNVGFVAGSIDDKEKAIKDMATTLEISEESVQKKLEASWIKDGMFVPIKTISQDRKQALSEALNAIDGASIQRCDVRVYPYGEMLAHVTGYVQNINAEELKKHKNEGYSETSMIGKAGLEQVLEKDLKPEDGYAITIYAEDGTASQTVVKKAKKDGKNIATTIDIQAQQVMYDQLKNDAGAGVMVGSKSGEVLAMVSMPSYNPNSFVLGMGSDEWDSLSNNPKTPLLDRTTSLYSPGSTFKAITGAVGIDTNTITNETAFEKSEKWQKDNSWGNNYVTTTKHYAQPSNLLNAYINSDNIYFAQLADKLGKTTFSKYLDSIGFNKSLDFTLPLQTSSYGKLSNDQKLAAAGYGQGELLISPLHLTSLYTAYKNDGTIMKPYLLFDSGNANILKKQAYKKETANLIFDDLKQTMDSFGANPSNAAGKTGTAQIKEGDEEIGWICTVNDHYAMTIMVDDTKEIGQSHYVIPKAQAILAAY